MFSYVHHNGKVGALVVLACETDFTAASPEFQTLGREIAMQVASMEPKDVPSLLAQTYIRDAKTTIAEQITAVASRVKEKIVVADFARFSL